MPTLTQGDRPLAGLLSRRMHADEIELDEKLVQGLVREQFPGVGGTAVAPGGAERHRQRDLPSRRGARRTAPLTAAARRPPAARSSSGCRGSRRCFPSRSRCRSPKVGRGATIPGTGRSTPGWRAAPSPSGSIDAVRAARGLAALVGALWRVDPAGAPRGAADHAPGAGPGVPALAAALPRRPRRRGGMGACACGAGMGGAAGLAPR